MASFQQWGAPAGHEGPGARTSAHSGSGGPQAVGAQGSAAPRAAQELMQPEEERPSKRTCYPAAHGSAGLAMGSTPGSGPQPPGMQAVRLQQQQPTMHAAMGLGQGAQQLYAWSEGLSPVSDDSEEALAGPLQGCEQQHADVEAGTSQHVQQQMPRLRLALQPDLLPAAKRQRLDTLPTGVAQQPIELTQQHAGLQPRAEHRGLGLHPHAGLGAVWGGSVPQAGRPSHQAAVSFVQGAPTLHARHPLGAGVGFEGAPPPSFHPPSLPSGMPAGPAALAQPALEEDFYVDQQQASCEMELHSGSCGGGSREESEQSDVMPTQPLGRRQSHVSAGACAKPQPESVSAALLRYQHGNMRHLTQPSEPLMLLPQQRQHGPQHLLQPPVLQQQAYQGQLTQGLGHGGFHLGVQPQPAHPALPQLDPPVGIPPALPRGGLQQAAQAQSRHDQGCDLHEWTGQSLDAPAAVQGPSHLLGAVHQALHQAVQQRAAAAGVAQRGSPPSMVGLPGQQALQLHQRQALAAEGKRPSGAGDVSSLRRSISRLEQAMNLVNKRAFSSGPTAELPGPADPHAQQQAEDSQETRSADFLHVGPAAAAHMQVPSSEFWVLGQVLAGQPSQGLAVQGPPPALAPPADSTGLHGAEQHQAHALMEAGRDLRSKLQAVQMEQRQVQLQLQQLKQQQQLLWQQQLQEPEHAGCPVAPPQHQASSTGAPRPSSGGHGGPEQASLPEAEQREQPSWHHQHGRCAFEPTVSMLNVLLQQEQEEAYQQQEMGAPQQQPQQMAQQLQGQTEEQQQQEQRMPQQRLQPGSEEPASGGNSAGRHVSPHHSLHGTRDAELLPPGGQQAHEPRAGGGEPCSFVPAAYGQTAAIVHSLLLHEDDGQQQQSHEEGSGQHLSLQSVLGLIDEEGLAAQLTRLCEQQQAATAGEAGAANHALLSMALAVLEAMPDDKKEVVVGAASLFCGLCMVSSEVGLGSLTDRAMARP